MPVAAVRGSFLLLQQRLGGGVRPKVDVEVVVVCGCVAVALWVRWSGVGGPGQSFDDGVVRVDHPAAALLMKDRTIMVGGSWRVPHLQRYTLWQHPKQGV